jgi:hypothetical protein
VNENVDGRVAQDCERYFSTREISTAFACHPPTLYQMSSAWSVGLVAFAWVIGSVSTTPPGHEANVT